MCYCFRAVARNRVFFPQEALDAWLSEGRVELTETTLTLQPSGRTYRIVEAAHVLSELTGAEDANDLVGKVKSTGYLGELGAELAAGSMILGDNAYDVVPGFLGVPASAFGEHAAKAGAGGASSDEEILRAFLGGA